LRPEQNFTTIHMGSSRYFIPHELRTTLRDDVPFHEPVPTARLADGLERAHRVRIPQQAEVRS
ncbi:MAG: hypothetical protein H6837_21600, partial [Planctomycetes bacterium]|nr:hypothetical protein [Planctomycetota bacterium]